MKQNNEELQIDIDFAFVVVEKSLLPKREYTQNLINKFLRLNLQVSIRLQSYTLIPLYSYKPWLLGFHFRTLCSISYFYSKKLSPHSIIICALPPKFAINVISYTFPFVC